MNYNNLIGTLTGIGIGLLLFILLFVIAYLVVVIIAKWKIFEKNGEEGWKAIIPFYNSYIYTKIAGLNWWYFVILIFGNALTNASNDSGTQLLGKLLSMTIYFLIFYNLAKKLKKEPRGFAILGAFFTPIIEIIAGFSNKYQFDNSVELNPNGIFGEKAQNQNIEPERYCLNCGQKIKSNSNFCENCGKPIE